MLNDYVILMNILVKTFVFLEYLWIQKSSDITKYTKA